MSGTRDKRRRDSTHGATAELASRLRLMLPVADTALDEQGRERIYERIVQGAGLAPVAPFVATTRAEGGDWRVLRPGVYLKVLQRDDQTGDASYLVHYTPGGRVERHPQGSIEECLLVSGDLVIGGVEMQPGDWQIARPGAEHGPLSSRRGALVFVRGILRKVPEERADPDALVLPRA